MRQPLVTVDGPGEGAAGPTPVGAEIGGRYTVHRELGRGGMGVVHLAEDRDLHRTVALKVLHEGAGSWIASRFVAEAQITAQLEHPNILPVYALDHTESGQPAFTMKVVEGDTFDDRIHAVRVKQKRKQGLDEDERLAERLEVFAKVCEGLSYAHERGVIHRDLKPENLMIGRHGEVYILDWGIAALLSDGSVGPTEQVVGTPAYMSPEQAKGEALGPASDQYALGLVLYELITLRRANSGRDLDTTLASARRAEVPAVRHLYGRRVHPDLRAIVAKATHADPGRRYADAEDLADDVRRFMRQEPTLARPDNLIRRLWRWGSRNPGILGGALAMAVMATLLVLGVAVGAVAVLQATASAQEAWVTARVSEVARRSHAIDDELRDTSKLLDRVGGTAEQLWRNGIPSEAELLHRRDFVPGERPTDFVHRPHYGNAVSMHEPLVLVAPGVDFEAVEAEVRRLAPIRTTLREAVVASADEALLAASTEEQDRVLGVEGAPASVAYVGLENGVMYNWPGHPRFPADYDPRKRAWYRTALETQVTTWGAPYQGASGWAVLLPCSRVLYDANGEVFGVVGLDMTLDRVVDMLAMPGAREAYLVDENGNVVVSTAQAGLTAQGGTQGNQPLGQEPFPDPVVREALRAERSGLIERGGSTYVWNRQTAVRWTYVVVTDRPGWL